MRDYIDHYHRDGFYFNYHDDSSRGRQQVERRRREAILSCLNSLKIGSRILDVGSGSGKLVKDLFYKKYQVFPIDLSSENLSRLMFGPGSHPVLADGYRLPYGDELFDAVILSSILEHCQSPEKMLSEAVRVMRRGGITIVVVPFNEKITYHQCIHCNKLTPAFAHLHSFDEFKMSSLFQECKLKIKSRFKFANIGLDFLHINLLMRSVPFRLWKIIDMTANLFISRPEFIIAAGRK